MWSVKETKQNKWKQLNQVSTETTADANTYKKKTFTFKGKENILEKNRSIRNHDFPSSDNLCAFLADMEMDALNKT